MRIINEWRMDEEWWKIIGPGGATYGDEIDGTKLFLGMPSSRVHIRFTKADNGTFGLSGYEKAGELPDGSCWSSEELRDYSLVDFHNDTSDVIWTRPNDEGKQVYQGGTDNAGNGAGIQWDQLGQAFFHAGVGLGEGIGGIIALATPEPTLVTKFVGVTALTAMLNEGIQGMNSSMNFQRSVNATYRLYLINQGR